MAEDKGFECAWQHSSISFLEAITTSAPCKHPPSYLARPSRKHGEILLQRQVKHVESEYKGIALHGGE